MNGVTKKEVTKKEVKKLPSFGSVQKVTKKRIRPTSILKAPVLCKKCREKKEKYLAEREMIKARAAFAKEKELLKFQ